MCLVFIIAGDPNAGYEEQKKNQASTLEERRAGWMISETMRPQNVHIYIQP